MILVVEDEPAVSSFVKEALEVEGHTVSVAARAREALELAEVLGPSLVVLDVMLPDMDGFQFLAKFRAKSDAPVLMLTARGSVDDRVRGLDGGADDYLVKPFKLEELLARVRALNRRSNAEASQITCGDLHIDLATRRVTRAGRQIFLSATEYQLLEVLARHAGVPVSKAVVLERIWDDDRREGNLVEVYMSYLRAKLERGGRPRIIQTVRGKGYMLATAQDKALQG